MSEPQKPITEADIIDARQRCQAAKATGEQIDFRSALLGLPGETEGLINHWLEVDTQIHWCECKDANTSLIVCSTCGLPPRWPGEDEDEAEEESEASQSADTEWLDKNCTGCSECEPEVHPKPVASEAKPKPRKVVQVAEFLDLGECNKFLAGIEVGDVRQVVVFTPLRKDYSDSVYIVIYEVVQ